MRISDGPGRHFTNSTFDAMRSVIGPDTLQATLGHLSEDYRQLAAWPGMGILGQLPSVLKAGPQS